MSFFYMILNSDACFNMRLNLLLQQKPKLRQKYLFIFIPCKSVLNNKATAIKSTKSTRQIRAGHSVPPKPVDLVLVRLL